MSVPSPTEQTQPPPGAGFDPQQTRPPPGEAVEDGWAPPASFDGYRRLARLGEGAMGAVYLAHDEVLDREVAVKFLRLADPESAGRFQVEARAIARLQHPNVVAIFRVGSVGSTPYLVSEFVRGRSLDRLALPLEPREVLRVALELSRGLAAAHRRGVLHRDLKPANVMLGDGGEVKLLDFGLAKLISEGEQPLLGPAAPLSPLPLPLRSQAGAIVGTPVYMAPELWRGESASFRSDVYALGALLHQLAEGEAPHARPTVAEVVRAALTEEIDPLTGVEPALAAIVQRCLARAPEDRYASAEEVRDALEALAPERRARRLPEGNPYRGLQAFEAEHRAAFFGRDPEVRALLERLRVDPFVLVAGTSGVGKSSLCRAGLLPILADGEGGQPPATVVTLTPGRHPLFALANALSGWLGDGRDAESLAEQLRDGWAEVARALRRRTRSHGPLVVFIDQLEELVTLSEPSEAAVISQVLETFSTPGTGLRLLATCRGDFIARVASLPGMSEGLTRALYVLKPLGVEGICEAIVGPAHAQGVRFESDALVEALIASTARTEGGLPLLQFALAELWDGREVASGRISAAALQALGGVEGALARHADAVVSHLPLPQRTAARRLLPQLVTLESTRARRTEEELGAQGPEAGAALAALVRGRLLVATEAPQGSAYEVAHEALIRAWPTLQGWLEEDADLRAVHGRLAAAVAEWERLGRRREALWSGRQLAQARTLDRPLLPARQREFLEASERGRRRSRWVRLGVGLGVVLAVGSTAVGIRLSARLALRRQVEALRQSATGQLAQARRTRAEVQARRAEALSLFDRHQGEAAEQAWSQVISDGREVDATLARAGQALESALVLGGEELTLRPLLADVLLERALEAESDHAPARVDELIARLALHDVGGERLRAWRRPAEVSFRTVPGARVELWRADGGHRWLRQDAVAGDHGVLRLEAGDYLLVAQRAPAAPVRLPFTLARGERRALDVPIPERLPEGFVFVPEGGLLTGSLGEDGLRRDFFHAAPLHPARTAAYLIARTETTFGDYLAFLDALPPRARAERAPTVGTGGFRGSLSVRRQADGWHLSFQPGEKAFRLGPDQPLALEGRAHPVAWTRLPVVGIRLEDAEAYAAWLGRSGQVPGARLCSELEWERAARGSDGRSYPHGDALAPADANFDETYGKKPEAMAPDPVGSHPASASPFGVEDLAGNVWEWVHPASPGEPVARGGSFAYGRSSARTENREQVEASLRDTTLGMRVCADAPR